MTKLRPALLLAALGGLLLATPAAAWERYTHGNLGFSVQVPTHLFRIDSRANERLRLSEVDGAALLDIYGMRNPELTSIEDFAAMLEDADPSRRITYRAGGNSWYVLSGYLENEAEPTIFYAKFMLSRDGTALSAFELSYPAAERRRLDRVVEQMEDTLSAPR